MERERNKASSMDWPDQLIKQLDALNEAELSTRVIEKKIKERKFPLRWNNELKLYEWSEGEIKDFYDDPENIRRTIYCQSVNIDETDGWGMFGYTPGFIYIERRNYKGSKTFADRFSALGLSVGVEPITGLSIMSHFDYFPRQKFDYRIIKKTENPEIFAVMCNVFNNKIKSDLSDGKTLPLIENK